jgi:hypothetical protein
VFKLERLSIDRESRSGALGSDASGGRLGRAFGCAISARGLTFAVRREEVLHVLPRCGHEYGGMCVQASCGNEAGR